MVGLHSEKIESTVGTVPMEDVPSHVERCRHGADGVDVLEQRLRSSDVFLGGIAVGGRAFHERHIEIDIRSRDNPTTGMRGQAVQLLMSAERHQQMDLLQHAREQCDQLGVCSRSIDWRITAAIESDSAQSPGTGANH